MSYLLTLKTVSFVYLFVYEGDTLSNTVFFRMDVMTEFIVLSVIAGVWLVGWWLSDPALLWETVSGYSALPRGISRYCQSTAGRQG